MHRIDAFVENLALFYVFVGQSIEPVELLAFCVWTILYNAPGSLSCTVVLIYVDAFSSAGRRSSEVAAGGGWWRGRDLASTL